MPSPEPLELLVVHRLGTERQAGHARVDPGRRVAALVGPRVGLEGHLGIVGEPEPTPDLLDDPCDDRRREQRRRPAAEEQALERRPLAVVGGVERVGAKVDLGLERPDEGVDPRLGAAGGRPGIDDEVAVRADRDAERDVDVERDRRTTRRDVSLTFIALASRCRGRR